MTLPVVVEFGATTRAGFAGHAAPTIELSTPLPVGRPRDAAEFAEVLGRCFPGLGVAADAQPLLFTGDPGLAGGAVRRVCDALGVPAVGRIPSACAALAAAGVDEAVVLDFGDAVPTLTALAARTDPAFAAVAASLTARAASDDRLRAAWAALRPWFGWYGGWWAGAPYAPMAALAVPATPFAALPLGARERAEWIATNAKFHAEADLHKLEARPAYAERIDLLAAQLSSIDWADVTWATIDWPQVKAAVERELKSAFWTYFDLTHYGIPASPSMVHVFERYLKVRLANFVEDLQSFELRWASSQSDQPINYTLPDGQTITVNDPRFRAPSVKVHPWAIALSNWAAAASSPLVVAADEEHLAALAPELAHLAAQGVGVTAVRRWVGAARLAADVSPWAATPTSS